jgi:hypothetical protein
MRFEVRILHLPTDEERLRRPQPAVAFVDHEVGFRLPKLGARDHTLNCVFKLVELTPLASD